MANDSTSEQRAALPVIITFTSDEMLALKELVVEKRRGFWRIYSLLISLCAFMLSLITAVISAYVSYKKDIHDQLGELSTAIGSLRGCT